jgi:hypothetical protein
MEEQFLNDIGKFLVGLVRYEITRPDRNRFSKSPRLPKTPRQYKVDATGNLKNSVSYRIQDNNIFILMNDYGVENVFQIDSEAGSFPGGGRYYPDTRPPSSRLSRSQLIDSLTIWAQKKLGKSSKEAKSMAFAVRKNLFKAGYGGVPLVDEVFQTATLQEINNLLERDEYREGLSNEFLDGLLDRITIIGDSSYNIIFGE